MSRQHLPAAQVAEVFRLIDELLSDERTAPHATRYTGVGMDPHAARAMALAYQADGLRSMLAGLLSDRTAGVTPFGIEWAIGWLRAELDREGEAP